MTNTLDSLDTLTLDALDRVTGGTHPAPDGGSPEQGLHQRDSWRCTLPRRPDPLPSPVWEPI